MDSGVARKLARHCAQHPDRQAIGVCVVTKKPICAECSTQYQGVNYSKQGLAQFLAGQKVKVGVKRGSPVLWTLLLLASPLMLYVTWLGFGLASQFSVDIIQASLEGDE